MQMVRGSLQAGLARVGPPGSLTALHTHLVDGQLHLSSAERDREGVPSPVLAVSSHSWTVPSPAPHLGLEEVLGTLNALRGDIDLGQASQDVQATVFLQLPCRRLAEDQKELRREGTGVSEG